MSEGMNPWLAATYNTHGTGEAAAEEQQKLAHQEEFAKLAAQHGLDLSTMSDEDIVDIHTRVYGVTDTAKTAAAEPTPPAPAPAAAPASEVAKTAEAETYHAEKVAFQEKFAEADLMGRVMAHAFTQELELIKKASEEKKDEKDAKKDKGKEPPKDDKKPEEEGKKDGDKDDKGGKEKHLPPWLMKKEGEDKTAAAKFEELAVVRAVEIAKLAEFDADVASKRVNAVATLGLQESEKIAHVKDTDAAIHIRGLEYLEAAGYPVNWEQIFSK